MFPTILASHALPNLDMLSQNPDIVETKVAISIPETMVAWGNLTICYGND